MARLIREVGAPRPGHSASSTEDFEYVLKPVIDKMPYDDYEDLVFLFSNTEFMDIGLMLWEIVNRSKHKREFRKKNPDSMRSGLIIKDYR